MNIYVGLRHLRYILVARKTTLEKYHWYFQTFWNLENLSNYDSLNVQNEHLRQYNSFWRKTTQNWCFSPFSAAKMDIKCSKKMNFVLLLMRYVPHDLWKYAGLNSKRQKNVIFWTFNELESCRVQSSGECSTNKTFRYVK